MAIPRGIRSHNRVHSATGRSPFEINYGYNAEIFRAPNPRHLSGRLRHHLRFRNAENPRRGQTSSGKSRQPNESSIRQKETTCDRVSSRRQGVARHDQPESPTTKEKTRDKRTGPFLIVAKKGASAYTLKLPSTWKIHPTFNESLLTPYTPPAFPNQEQPPPPPPDLVNGEEQYEIEEVLDSRERKVRGKTENHGAGLQTTSSSGKATDQSPILGYEKATWMQMNSSTITSCKR